MGFHHSVGSLCVTRLTWIQGHTGANHLKVFEASLGVLFSPKFFPFMIQTICSPNLETLRLSYIKLMQYLSIPALIELWVDTICMPSILIHFLACHPAINKLSIIWWPYHFWRTNWITTHLMLSISMLDWPLSHVLPVLLSLHKPPTLACLALSLQAHDASPYISTVLQCVDHCDSVGYLYISLPPQIHSCSAMIWPGTPGNWLFRHCRIIHPLCRRCTGMCLFEHCFDTHHGHRHYQCCGYKPFLKSNTLVCKVIPLLLPKILLISCAKLLLLMSNYLWHWIVKQALSVKFCTVLYMSKISFLQLHLIDKISLIHKMPLQYLGTWNTSEWQARSLLVTELHVCICVTTRLPSNDKLILESGSPAFAYQTWCLHPISGKSDKRVIHYISLKLMTSFFSLFPSLDLRTYIILPVTSSLITNTDSDTTVHS